MFWKYRNNANIDDISRIKYLKKLHFKGSFRMKAAELTLSWISVGFKLTQQDRSDVYIQSLSGTNLHLQTGRVETAGGLLLPGQEAGPGFHEGLPAWEGHTGMRNTFSFLRSH